MIKSLPLYIYRTKCERNKIIHLARTFLSLSQKFQQLVLSRYYQNILCFTFFFIFYVQTHSMLSVIIYLTITCIFFITYKFILNTIRTYFCFRLSHSDDRVMNHTFDNNMYILIKTFHRLILSRHSSFK